MADVETEIKEWGNSLGVRLPKAILKAEGIKPGDKVRIHVERVPPKTGAWGLMKRLPGFKHLDPQEVIRDFEKSRRAERKAELARERRLGLR